jgi:hypothetical protein
MQDLINQSKDGEKSVISGINELKKYNYIKRFPIRDKCKIIKWETYVYEYPQNQDTPLVAENRVVAQSRENSLLAENLQVENLQVENEGLLNNDHTNNDLTNNNILAIDQNFENLWSLFPNKKGKASVNKKSKEYFYNLGLDKSKEIINRYLKYVAERRKEFPSLDYKYGSTFFNSGYIDYLDENYTEYKAKVYNNKPQQSTNYEQRKYDDDFFENLYDNIEYIK